MLNRGLAILAVLMLATTAFGAGPQVTLKKSFWSGWQYSTDGTHFERVGVSANGLRTMMSANQEATKQLDSYKSKETAAAVIGIPAGFLIGWPIGANIGGKEWSSSYTTMIVAGASLAVVGMIVESSGTKNLKKAVDIYNGNDQSMLDHLNVGLYCSRDYRTQGLRLSYSF